MLIALALVLFVSAYSVAASRHAAVETGAWGLSFQKEGACPVGTVSQSVLDAYDAKYIGDTSKKTICLTFDAGYENGCTAKILDVLKAHNVKATFFLVGNYLEQNPELVCRITEEGHTVGNHTYHHYNMSEISDEAAFQKELVDVETLYEKITGKEMSKYYRPPQGVYSEENLKMAKELGYKTVFWSLAYVDWKNDDQPTKDEAFSKLVPRIHNGAIVLLHSTSQANADILDELLTKWENLGYSFVTLDEVYAS
ncbi:MAG: polysaccharide deacetylase family protein [Oscillospiraceae bacterium]|nr:polysaccharide deacetylase family protein [Oscillospiraceae bacterium]